MAEKEKDAQKPYLRRVLEFYFAPETRSFVTVLYLLFFLYFIVFYFDYVVLAVRFLWYTLKSSTIELSLMSLFWGALFIIALIIPFSVSCYALLIPFELRKKQWERVKKVVVTVLVAVVVLDVVILMDSAIRFLKKQSAIQTFLIRENIYLE